MSFGVRRPMICVWQHICTTRSTTCQSIVMNIFLDAYIFVCNYTYNTYKYIYFYWIYNMYKRYIHIIVIYMYIFTSILFYMVLYRLFAGMQINKWKHPHSVGVLSRKRYELCEETGCCATIILTTQPYRSAGWIDR